MKDTNNQLLERIEKCKNSFSNKQKHVAEYLLRDYKQAAFMGIVTMSKKLKVSPATLHRFAATLGYSGYAHMQRNLQEYVLAYLTSEDRLEISSTELNNDSKEKGQNFFKYVILKEVEGVQNLIQSIDPQKFFKASEMISKAKKIITVGLMNASCIAQYLGYNLKKIHSDVTTFQHGDIEDFLKICALDNQSLAIIIAFSRYHHRIKKITENISNQKAKIIGITENALSPITEYCDLNFFVPTFIDSFAGSITAPICLANALLVGYSQIYLNNAKAKLKGFENIVKTEKLFTEETQRGNSNIWLWESAKTDS